MGGTTHLLQIAQATPKELEERIINRLRVEFESIKREFKPREPEEYLTRNEVSKLLKCDISSVHNWTKAGKLKSYGISNRVYYKRSEVEAAIQPID